MTGPAQQTTSQALAFAANLPTDQQDILRRIDQEASMGLRGRESGTFRSISNSVESVYQQTVGRGQNGDAPYFADRDKAVEFMKECYGDWLGKSDPKYAGFPPPRGMIGNENNFSLVRAHHGISDEELGLSVADREKITEAMQEAYTIRGMELYAEAEMRIKAGGRELTIDDEYKSSTYFGREISPAALLQGARYALEKGGHDMKSDASYQLIDPDMTKQKFDQMLQNAQAAQPQQEATGPRQNAQYTVNTPQM